MAEELLVTLNRTDNTGFGFSLLGTAGLPHIVYDIVENSPAAESGKVEAGDVILRVNEVDVNRLSTKEVLKCLRLSSDPVTLKLRRDPAIKARVRRLLSPGHPASEEFDVSSRITTLKSVTKTETRTSTSTSTSSDTNLDVVLASDGNEGANKDPKNEPGSPELAVGSPQAPSGAHYVAAATSTTTTRTNGSYSDVGSCSSELEALLPQADSFKEEERAQWEPLSSVDKFNRQKNPPRFEAYMMTGDLMLNLSRTQQSSGLLPKYSKKVDSLRYNNHHHHQHIQYSNHNHHNHHHYHHHNSVPTSPNEMLSHRMHKGGAGVGSGTGSNSASTSPVGINSRRDHNVVGLQFGNGSGCGVGIGLGVGQQGNDSGKSNNSQNNFGYSSSFVRTSRSEDHLQFQKDPSMSAVDIDIDDDVTSSLNTLLDTRPDSGQGISTERIVWTYNAPVSSPSASERTTSCCQNGSSSQSSTSSRSSTEGTSPQRSLSPASPTSVSSSVMSSNSGSRRFPLPVATTTTSTTGTSSTGNANIAGGAGGGDSSANALPSSSSSTLNAGGASNNSLGYFHQTGNGDLSQSEAISNMSSPDYNDEETMDILSARDIMMVSDPSDSDSTILASEPPQRRSIKNNNYNNNQDGSEHRIVIQVKGPDKDSTNNPATAGTAASTNNRNNSPRQTRRRGNNNPSESLLNPSSQNTNQQQQRSQSVTSSGNVTPEFVGYQELKESEDEREMQNASDYDEQQNYGRGSSSPTQSADEESDIESLHSFHYSPKAVDQPSAIRLAKRLYSLDGFKKSDVSRHLSKNNDFSRAVAEEYLRYFNFVQDTLDVALRKFLAQFSLTGETQERERVLVHFSKRFLDCNPGTFNSHDAVHTLTCAIMLLNTDLHGQNIGRKMSCSEFIENLSELNDGDNFPREVLKQLYNAIKSFPLEWALDDEGDDAASQIMQQGDGPTVSGTGNPFLDVPNVTGATEFKKGYVMRKCCYDANGKKTPFGKRGWKMYYCTLRELVLYLHKDEHSFRSDSLHNAIRIHHALATKAADYTKKQHVFRLQTADQAEYLFQTSDSKELQSWIDTINFVCASFSCQPLAGAVGSQRKFQRPLLPCSHTKLSPREQLRDHEEIVSRLEAELDEHRRHPPERNAKALSVQNYKEKDVYLHYELKRYKTYAYLLRSRLAFTDVVEPSLVESSIGEVDEGGGGSGGSGNSGGGSVSGSGSGGISADPEAALVPPPVPDRLPSNRKDPVMT